MPRPRPPDEDRRDGDAVEEPCPEVATVVEEASAWRAAQGEPGKAADAAALKQQLAAAADNAAAAQQSPRKDAESLLGAMEERLRGERTAFLERLVTMVELELQEHDRMLMHQLQGTPLTGLPDSSNGESAHREGSHNEQGERKERCVPHLWTAATAGAFYTDFIEEDEMDAEASSCTRREGSERLYKSKFIAALSSQHKPSETEQTYFRRFVASSVFEIISCSAILANVMVMALEVQYTGCRVGRKIHHLDCVGTPMSDWLRPSIEVTFTVMALLFSTYFILEFVCRVCYLKTKAVYSGWIWFDAVVLLLGLLDTVGRLGSALDLGVNPSAMRAARIMRMLRMLKFFRVKESFHTLFLLLKSILASRHAFVWSVLIILFTMTCAGLLINQLLYTYLQDEMEPEDARREVYEYFGTYTRMIITMFEVTLGNWAPPTRLLMAKVSQWWGLFIVLYRCVLCFALVNVTSAVFITETSRVAADDEVQMLRKARNEKKIARTLVEVFLEMDTSCDGHLTLQELSTAMQDSVVKDLLEVMDLRVRDIQELFELMDDGSGLVRQEEFIRYILEFRGPAQSIKQMAMLRILKGLSARVEGLREDVNILVPGRRSAQGGPSGTSYKECNTRSTFSMH